MSKKDRNAVISSAKSRLNNEIGRTKKEIADIKAKKRTKTQRPIGKKGIIISGLKTTIVRCVEIFAITMLGVTIIFGVGANLIPMLAIMMAQEIGMPELIQSLAGKDASGITSGVCTIIANWGLPMLFIILAVVIIFSKLLFLVSRKINRFCNRLIGNESDIDDDIDDDDFSDASRD